VYVNLCQKIISGVDSQPCTWIGDSSQPIGNSDSSDMSRVTTLMLQAVENEDVEEVKRQLAPGARAYSEKALLLATAKGNIEIVEALVESGADANWVNEDGRTALMIVAGTGRDDIATLLVEKGRADVELNDRQGRSPLSLAAERGHIYTVNLLINQGSIIDSKDELGRSPLSYAAENGNASVVELLVQRGADVNLKDRHGRSPLSLAAQKGHWEVVEQILNYGAYIDREDDHEQTALYVASARGSETVVELLLDKGAKVDVKNRDGETALLAAVKYGHRAVVNMLLAKGAVPSITTKLGQTAFDAATIRDEAAAIRVDPGADEEPLRQLLENPPVIQTQATEGDVSITSTRWPAVNGAERSVCQEFRAFVLEKLHTGELQTKWVSIYSLIYDKIKSRKELASNPEPSGHGPKFERWTWIHLPANNVSLQVITFLLGTYRMLTYNGSDAG